MSHIKKVVIFITYSKFEGKNHWRVDFQHLMKILLKKWNLDIINYSTEKNAIIVKILYLTGMNHYT